MRRLPEALADELDREPAWMYAWQLGPRRAPIFHPFLESIHATRADLVEQEVRAALTAAGPQARALDLACCEGWFAHRLLDWGAHEVIGVDIREQSVRRAELVRDYLGIDAQRLRFRTGDVLALTAEELGTFDVVLCLGLIYHVEHPMGVLRLARALTRDLCVIESQTARVETPALFGFGSRETFEATDAVIAIHHEADQAINPLASHGGALSFCPNPVALRLMATAAGFAEISAAVLGPGHDPDFHTGDRAVLFARPG
jgi:2-polyprenyl-3-methyl-5-hydroxy-6-metoxy-1,4-benzoquinol methylase